jgi:hypothetical protein
MKVTYYAEDRQAHLSAITVSVSCSLEYATFLALQSSYHGTHEKSSKTHIFISLRRKTPYSNTPTPHPHHHNLPPTLCTSEEVERLGEYMARKLGWVERFPEWRKKPLIAFLHRHIEKLGKGEPLQLIMRFYGRGAEDVVWHVEWRNGWLGIVGEEGWV